MSQEPGLHSRGAAVAGARHYDERADADVLLRDVVDHADTAFSYGYDFGDDWQHHIRVEQLRRDVPPADVPRLLEGARACPPEDCGGVPGYYELLETIADPQHEKQESLLEWVGEPYDPDEYDVAAHERALAMLRALRRLSRTWAN